MMPKAWLKKPKFNYSKNVVDVVQFGSSVLERGEPNDLDVTVIFKKIPLKEQLNETQKIKLELQKFTNLPIHAKAFDLYSLFEPSNFARENILFFGKSLVSGKPFSGKLGFTPKSRINYSLKKLEKKDKVKFNYLLSGKGGKYGLLKKYNGRLVKPGVIEVEPQVEEIFKEGIGRITRDFFVERIMLVS